jgi:hypothetical protein
LGQEDGCRDRRARPEHGVLIEPRWFATYALDSV